MKPLISLLTLASFLWSAGLACAEGTAKQADKKQKIVVFSAHPADSESGIGGLAATLAKQGHEVIFAVASAFRGQRKIDGKLEVGIRSDEEAAACKLLGVTSKIFPYDHNLPRRGQSGLPFAARELSVEDRLRVQRDSGALRLSQSIPRGRQSTVSHKNRKKTNRVWVCFHTHVMAFSARVVPDRV
jgi:LmbE family N-acetylglucosaminyl deacetylase